MPKAESKAKGPIRRNLRQGVSEAEKGISYSIDTDLGLKFMKMGVRGKKFNPQSLGFFSVVVAHTK